MFESEIKRLIDYNISLIEPLGDYLTLETIAGQGLHQSAINYLNAEVDNLLYTDRNRILKKSVFDYSGEKISNYFSSIEREIKNKYIFSSDDIKDIISKSVYFNFNFLLRPNITISNLLFHNNEAIEIDDLFYLLKYVCFYPYIKEIILNYFNKKTLLSIDKINFNILLTNIQHLLSESSNKTLLIDELKVITSFINFGTDSSLIPASAVGIYLSDKGKSELIEKLKVFASSSDSYLSIEVLIDELFIKQNSYGKEAVIESLIEVEENKEDNNTKVSLPKEEVFQRIHTLSDESSNENSETVEKEIQVEIGNELVNEADEFEFDKYISEEKEKDITSNQITINEQFDIVSEPTTVIELENNANSVSEELDTQIKEEADFSKQSGMEEEKSIFEFLSDKETDRIIENLFNNDSMDFINIMEKISKSSGISEAFSILQNFCEVGNMISDKKSLSLLQEKIEEYFNNKGK